MSINYLIVSIIKIKGTNSKEIINF